MANHEAYSEYYFSVDNLCKDMFLRKHMDSQGFVLLSVIADFNRIRQLTHDLELLRYACYHLRIVEYRCGADGLDRLRKREGWEQWVLGMDDRDPSARNPGPSDLQNASMPPPLDTHPQFACNSHAPVSPPTSSAAIPPNGSMYGFAPNSYQPHISPATMVPDEANFDVQTLQTPLSAAVPDFAPAEHTADTRGVPDSHLSGMEDAFSDEEVNKLVVVVRKQGSTPPDVPFRNPASRTFSNGSLDGAALAETKVSRQSQPVVNGTLPLNG